MAARNSAWDMDRLVLGASGGAFGPALEWRRGAVRSPPAVALPGQHGAMSAMSPEELENVRRSLAMSPSVTADVAQRLIAEIVRLRAEVERLEVAWPWRAGSGS